MPIRLVCYYFPTNIPRSYAGYSAPPGCQHTIKTKSPPTRIQCLLHINRKIDASTARFCFFTQYHLPLARRSFHSTGCRPRITIPKSRLPNSNPMPPAYTNLRKHSSRVEASRGIWRRVSYYLTLVVHPTSGRCRIGGINETWMEMVRVST